MSIKLPKEHELIIMSKQFLFVKEYHCRELINNYYYYHKSPDN